jgi:hypothetical protein
MTEAEPIISDQHAYRSHYEVAGPHWLEACGHGGYVGTIWPIDSRLDANGKRVTFRQILDVYVFDQSCGQSLCLRYGDQGHEYISPGPLVEFIQRNSYPDVVKLLMAKGKITWTPK